MTDHKPSRDVLLAAVLRVEEDGAVNAVRSVRAGTGPSAGGIPVPTPKPVIPSVPDLYSWDGTAEPGSEITLAVIGSAFAEELRVTLETAGVDGVTALQRALEQGRIVLIEIAPAAFLGLTRRRRPIRSLRIDDNLFFFVTPGVRQARLANLLADLVSSSTST